MRATETAGQTKTSDEYAEGYEAGRRDAMLGMLMHLCAELHSASFSAGYEKGAQR